MSAIKRSETSPELELRKKLSARQLRYRLHKADLPGRPDIAFVGAKVLVFCDGDFWHGKRWIAGPAPHFRVRDKYWQTKIASNIARDIRVTRELRKLGWIPLRYWESDIKKHGEQVAD